MVTFTRNGWSQSPEYAGEDDVISLSSILRNNSQEIALALDSHRLVITAVQGAGKLGYQVSVFRAMVCGVQVFFDDDNAGKQAIKTAIDSRLLLESEYLLARAIGMKESEFEDIIEPDIYLKELESLLGLDIPLSVVQNQKRKWSDKIEDFYTRKGKVWSDTLEHKIKYLVAKKVAEKPQKALLDYRREPIDSLTKILIARLG